MTMMASWNGKSLRTSSAGIAMAMIALAGHHALALDAQEGGGGRTAEFIIINNDDPGEGLNDPTPVEPVGGNEGETLGAQRLNVFKAAVRVWEKILVSDVPIEFEAQFDELFCDEESAVLGSAGPITAAVNFSGAMLADTLYVAAQANQQAGFDLDPDRADLSARFNSLLGTDPDCLGGISFYLGLDGRAGARGHDRPFRHDPARNRPWCRLFKPGGQPNRRTLPRHKRHFLAQSSGRHARSQLARPDR